MIQLNSRRTAIVAFSLVLMIAGCSQGADSTRTKGTNSTEIDQLEVERVITSGLDIDLSESCLDGDGISLCLVSAGEAAEYQNVISDEADFNSVAPGDSIALIANLGGSPAGSVGFGAAFIEGPGVVTLDLGSERAQLSPDGAEAFQISDLANPWQSEDILQSESGSLIDSLPGNPSLRDDGIMLIPFSGTWDMTSSEFVFACPVLEVISAAVGGFLTNPISGSVEIDASLNDLAMMLTATGEKMQFTRSLNTLAYTARIPISDTDQQAEFITTLNVLKANSMEGSIEIVFTPDCSGVSEFTLEYSGDSSTAVCHVASGGLSASTYQAAGCFDDCSDGFCSRDFGDPCADVVCDGDLACFGGYCFSKDAVALVDPCDGVTCPATQVCAQGGCFDMSVVTETSSGDPCDGVTCPATQVCFQGGCFETLSGDPCDGVTCPATQVCVQGGCFDSSVVTETSPGDLCAGVTCPATQVCVQGGCFETSSGDPCDGVTCPATQVCVQGGCFDETEVLAARVDDPCENIACPATQVCQNGGCFDSCTTSSEVVVCASEQIAPSCVPDCLEDQLCVSGTCVSNEIFALPLPLGVSFANESSSLPSEGMVSIEVFPVHVENPDATGAKETKITSSYMVLTDAAYEGNPDRPLADANMIRIYRIDPLSLRQTLWADATVGDGQVTITTDRSGFFVFYLFESAQSAEGASTVLLPAVQSAQE